MEGGDPNEPGSESNGGTGNENQSTTGNPPMTGSARSDDDGADGDQTNDDTTVANEADGAAAAASPSTPAVPPNVPMNDASGGAAATPTRAGPLPVLLRSAGDYAILAQSAITNVPTSRITGDLGISPAAASSITGFPLTRQGTQWTAPEVLGSVFAADNDAPTPGDLTSAIADMQTAYDDAAGRTTPAFLNLGAGSIGGLTLAPGLYEWTSVVTIPSNVTLFGDADDVWIFQISGDLALSSGQQMNLTGGAQAENIVWQVAGFVDLGTSSHAEGIMLSKTAIHLHTGASINGRLLAQTAVTLELATVTEPSP
jgi:hypothetical protein